MVAESARAEGHELVAVAIREEAPPEIEQAVASCHWISLGDLSKLIKIFREAGVSEAVMDAITTVILDHAPSPDGDPKLSRGFCAGGDVAMVRKSTGEVLAQIRGDAT